MQWPRDVGYIDVSGFQQKLLWLFQDRARRGINRRRHQTCAQAVQHSPSLAKISRGHSQGGQHIDVRSTVNDVEGSSTDAFTNDASLCELVRNNKPERRVVFIVTVVCSGRLSG
jgi:hypothetical protein